MRRTIAALAAAAMLAVVWAVPATAITWGRPDTADDFPYVGTILFERADGFYSCTGTLLSPTVMLTAGHCTEEGGVANLATWATFDRVVDVEAIANRDLNTYPTLKSFLDEPDHGWIRGDAHPHPEWDDGAGFPDTRDVGVVVLRQDVELEAYGELPTLGQFDDLDTSKGAAADRRFVIVGYGLQGTVPAFASDLGSAGSARPR